MATQKIENVLLNRRRDTNKSDYGHVFVIAGSLGMTGAAYLASQAALLSGSGLVTLGIPKSLNTILARKLVEVMTRPLAETRQRSLSKKAFGEIESFISLKKPSVLAIGPGLSQNKETQALVRNIVSKIDLPMVIDADGLNALAGRINFLPNTVITPHPGELARLLNTTVKDIQKDRKYIAKKTAAKYNIIVVLKGNKTIVAGPQGNVYVNNTGNPGMATAGCGDVLTGMIASFIGQGMEPFRAARLGVNLHGKAGDLVEKETGQASLRAADLLNKIPKAILSLK